MFNSTEIQIAQIKDLRLIFFYNCEQTLNNSYLGLKIVYDNDKSLDLKYRDEYFNEFIAKVIDVYNKEKGLGNVRFLDARTEEIFTELNNLPSISQLEVKDFLQTSKMNTFNNRRIELSRIAPYMKDMIINFLWSMEQTDNMKVVSFIGNKDKFLCTYKVKNKTFSVPTFVSLNSYDKFNVNFSYHKGDTFLIDGHIDFKLNYVNGHWIDNHKVISGKNIYHIDKNKFESLVRTSQGPIFYDQSYPIMTEQDRIIIEQYLNILDIPCFTQITKTLDNSFIMLDDSGADLKLKRRGYVTIDHDIVNILIKNVYGVTKSKEQLFITLDEQIESIIIKLEKILGLNVLIIQREYLPGIVCSGQYKKDFLNKYNYKVLLIDNDNLLLPFKVTDQITLEDTITSNYDLTKKLKGVN